MSSLSVIRSIFIYLVNYFKYFKLCDSNKNSMGINYQKSEIDAKFIIHNPNN